VGCVNVNVVYKLLLGVIHKRCETLKYTIIVDL
jgi:hypothetical protein